MAFLYNMHVHFPGSTKTSFEWRFKNNSILNIK